MKKIGLPLCFSLLMACAAQASDWPTGTIDVVVPYAPGGAADVMGRIFVDAVSRRIGQTLVVRTLRGQGGCWRRVRLRDQNPMGAP